VVRDNKLQEFCGKFLEDFSREIYGAKTAGPFKKFAGAFRLSNGGSPRRQFYLAFSFGVPCSSISFRTYSASATLWSFRAALPACFFRAARMFDCRIPAELTANPESNCSISALSQAGHVGAGESFKMIKSNSQTHSRHRYSYIGISPLFLRRGFIDPVTPLDGDRAMRHVSRINRRAAPVADSEY
jgi:hypothetical protein